MTDKTSVLSTAVRHPLSFAIVLFTVVIALIYLDYRSILKESNPSSSGENVANTESAPPFALKPPNLGDSGRSQPRIMDNMAGAQGGSSGAPGLEGLISGLEAKVKADPKDVGKRILLAQTYKELGMMDKSLSALADLRKEFPEHVRVKLVTAAILSQRESDKELKEALGLLDDLSKSDDSSIKQYLVKMYQGDAYIRLKNHDGALEKWKAALESMPPADSRHAILQKRIQDLNAAQPASKPAAEKSSG